MNLLIKEKFLELERQVGNMTITNYPAGDFLIRVKNVALASGSVVTVPTTKLVHSLAKCLCDEGFLQDVKVSKGILTTKIGYSHKEPVLVDLKLVSKPGLRVYKSINDLKDRKSTSSFLILSTPKGVITSKKAIKENVGGEVIAEVW